MVLLEESTAAASGVLELIQQGSGPSPTQILQPG
jgi:hypothetical protein